MNTQPSREEILSLRNKAVEEGQLVVYYQPQYNHSTGMLLGAEALVRWNFPEYGIISPALFVPLFEDDGFITNVDLFVFEQVCIFLRNSIDKNLVTVPISVNVSAKDLAHPDYVSKIDAIRNKYNIPVNLIRLELTESATAQNLDSVLKFINDIHALGYQIEMDDFGSGYSSLNVLKDVNFDIIKIDMRFLVGNFADGKGGTIISSVVRMCKWLALPVIIEGVETRQQADFMKSIGCDYIQGYFYSKPLPEAEYIKKISVSAIGGIEPQFNLVSKLDADKFWSPESLETLIFSNFVGGAAIFEYDGAKAEILRVNEKYLKEMGMNLTVQDVVSVDPFTFLDEDNAKLYKDMLARAIKTEDEQECETWRTITSGCCGKETLCIRSNVRLIGKSPVGYMFYVMIRNVTAEKRRFSEIEDSERRFKMASEQVNIYYWEYTVATKEMRPCFRCMRDLGLPALVTNYPEPAIEMGIFPPDYADMYRDWHKQIAAGVESLEAVIPLTVGRVPFLVRYTTEFDELHRPVKAYGSAALVIDK